MSGEMLLDAFGQVEERYVLQAGKRRRQSKGAAFALWNRKEEQETKEDKVVANQRAEHRWLPVAMAMACLAIVLITLPGVLRIADQPVQTGNSPAGDATAAGVTGTGDTNAPTTAGIAVVPQVNTYIGEWRDGKWTLNHTVNAYSDVKVTVLDLTIHHDGDYNTGTHHAEEHHSDEHHGSEGCIMLELESETDQTVELRLEASRSCDELATVLNKTISLKAGQPLRCEPLCFEGWATVPYAMYIDVGNTQVIFTIYPPAEE